MAPMSINDMPTLQRSEPFANQPSIAADVPEGAEAVTLQGYPTVPIGGVLCLPKIGTYEGEIKDLMGSNAFFDAALQVAELVKHRYVLFVAAAIAVILSFVFLFTVEWAGKILVYLSIVVLAVVPAIFGSLSLYAAAQGEESEYGKKVAAADLGLTGTQGDMIIGVIGVGISCIVLLCACFQCKQCTAAAAAAQDAADCLMTMPSLMLEPLISFLLKIPLFILTAIGLLLLLTSGDYKNVDLTKPDTLLHPDNFSVLCAIYFGFVMLWTLELLHYISVFVVIYVAEVWYFNHYGKGTARSSLCSMCGPTLILKAWCVAVTKHLGSLVYAALLMTLLRFVRWIVQAILTAEETADNPMCSCCMAVVKWITGACLAVMQRIVDLTSQIAFMQIAYEGSMGFCEAQKHAISIVFGEAVKWSTVEGVATTFVALGVGGISAGTCVLTFMLTKTLPQFSDEASQLYVSDPRGMAVAAGLVSMLMSLSVLHHFITIADTMAYCKGLLEHEKKMAEPQVEERKGTCWNCWTKPPAARETEALLRKE